VHTSRVRPGGGAFRRNDIADAATDLSIFVVGFVPGLIRLRSFSTRARFVLAACVASLPLLALVAYAANDRYHSERVQAERSAQSRAQLWAALIGEASLRNTPISGQLSHLFRLSPLPTGTTLAVLAGNSVVARGGPPGTDPPVNSRTEPILTRRDGTFYATGADGVQRIWGVAPVTNGLTVAYGRAARDAYGPARTALIRDLALAVAATLLAVLAAFVLGGRVTRPIRRLAARVGGGGPDELGSIELGFHTLGAAVAEGEAELARRAERLATLHSIDRAILDAETPEEIAQAALGRLRALAGAARASVVLFDRDRRRAQWLSVDTTVDTRVPAGAEHALDDGLFPIESLQAGDAAIHPDIAPLRGTSELVAALDGDGIRSYTVLPLICGGELLGSLTLGYVEPGGPSGDALAVAREVADQLAIALRQSRLLIELEAVLDAALDAIVVVDSERRVLSANEAATAILERPRPELVGLSLDGGVLTGLDDSRWQSFLADGSFEDVLTLEHADGVRREVEARGRAEFLPGRHLLVLRDVTDRRRLESQLRQAQKMEAIGRFAGGVAHDFNNLLTAVSGFSAIARRKVADGPGAAEIDQVDRAAERATRLTYQLLAFAREQIVEPVVLDLGEVVTSLMPMLTRLIGEDVETVVVADHASSILADRGQLEQVIVNLAVNARDAMPSGGTLTIETRDETVDRRYAASHAGVQPGRFVCLTVTDTGGGISPETRQHLFEPFYTTKEQGRGTGLGLATVHGIVTQSGGHIGVYSEPKLGTTFKLYFPITTAVAPTAAPEATRPAGDLAGTETVLLCEDDELVRMYIEEILREFGYTVVSCARPSEAIDFATRDDEPIAVLVTDIVMPQMSGPELAERLKASDPELKILFLSGYSAETIRQRGGLPVESAFLEKPFDDVSLLRTMRALLDTSSERDALRAP
jgi:signal transduction histidine kinase